MGKDLSVATVVARRDVTQDLMILELEPSIPFSFKPGQYCTIALNDIPRPYSICSSPAEPHLELFVKLVPRPAGNLTPLLWELKPGDAVTLYPKAKGVFTLDTSFRNHVLVATGTGVAPYVSMVRSYSSNPHHRLCVLYGTRFQDELVYDQELSHVPFLVFAPTISKPELPRNAGWKGFCGHVTHHIETLLKWFSFSPADTMVYACGRPDMVVDITRIAEAKGFTVKEEKYWRE